MAKKLKGGCLKSTEEQILNFIEDLSEFHADNEDVDPMFIQGVLATFSFFTCEKDSDIYGSSVYEFFEGAYPKAEEHIIQEEAIRQLLRIIEERC